MKRRTVLGTIVGVVAGTLSGCAGGSGGQADEVVEVGPGGRYTFEPGTDSPLRIPAGTTVRFDWQSDTHNVVVEHQPEAADWAGHETIEDAGFSFTHTFDVAGEYHYVCEPHRGLGMVGDVVVEPSG